MEVYVPSTNKSCILPSLPEKRSYHSLDQLTACGGFDGGVFPYGYPLLSCSTFSGGKWTTSKRQLKETRGAHTSWISPIGIVLIGGSPGTSFVEPSIGQKSKTTNIISSSGVSTVGFELRYNAWWVLAKSQRFSKSQLTHQILVVDNS